MVLLPLVCYSQDAYVCSRATYYGSPDCLGTPNAADALEGSSSLTQLLVRCKVPQLCTEDGVRVVVTDYGEGDKTDFIISTRSYSRLARPNAALDLFAYGVVDIEYRRIPCQYPGYNLMVKVHEHSRFPEYLAVVMLYQAGQNDITAAEVWQADCQQWRGMRKAYGAVWDMANPPAGALNFRVQPVQANRAEVISAPCPHQRFTPLCELARIPYTVDYTKQLGISLRFQRHQAHHQKSSHALSRATSLLGASLLPLPLSHALPHAFHPALSCATPATVHPRAPFVYREPRVRRSAIVHPRAPFCYLTPPASSATVRCTPSLLTCAGDIIFHPADIISTQPTFPSYFRPSGLTGTLCFT
ncbi:hypothetical protein TEA_016076 [Camellia sinensis var. sinensis]|uniref:Expansin-like EG45 domain-containing protein n=1 Tax=Camellia sinensis var. sinensis TaxID=542762 RepID=A0A4S4DJX6_CAMSN|nr:hypothetical protein TEA_016076 [Camellia sinensis var. sinensis]